MHKLILNKTEIKNKIKIACKLKMYILICKMYNLKIYIHKHLGTLKMSKVGSPHTVMLS